MPRELKEGSLFLDDEQGMPLIGTMAIGDGYFCDPGQDFSEWTIETGVRTNLLRVVDADGDIAWGHIGDDAIGIPFDAYNSATPFQIGEDVRRPANPERATIVAIYSYGPAANQDGVLIVNTVVNTWDDNEGILGMASGAVATVDAPGNVITAATINACEIWSQRRGGTMNWADIEGFSWDPTAAALSYEVRGREYLTNCYGGGLELGSTVTDTVRLTRLGIPRPEVEYIPYSRTEVRGDGTTLGLGSGVIIWSWEMMSQAQVNRLLYPFPGDTDSSVVVFVWSFIDSGAKRTLVSFRGVMHRPIDGSSKQLQRRSIRPNYSNVVARITHAVEAH